jgi:hypothetical protein
MYRRSVDGDEFIVSQTTRRPPHPARIHRSCGPLALAGRNKSYSANSALRVLRMGENTQSIEIHDQNFMRVFSHGHHAPGLGVHAMRVNA